MRTKCTLSVIAAATLLATAAFAHAEDSRGRNLGERSGRMVSQDSVYRQAPAPAVQAPANPQRGFRRGDSPVPVTHPAYTPRGPRHIDAPAAPIMRNAYPEPRYPSYRPAYSPPPVIVHRPVIVERPVYVEPVYAPAPVYYPPPTPVYYPEPAPVYYPEPAATPYPDSVPEYYPAGPAGYPQPYPRHYPQHSPQARGPNPAGAIVGAVIGGAIGNAVSQGSMPGTAIGAVLGGIIGGGL